PRRSIFPRPQDGHGLVVTTFQQIRGSAASRERHPWFPQPRGPPPPTAAPRRGSRRGRSATSFEVHRPSIPRPAASCRRAASSGYTSPNPRVPAAAPDGRCEGRAPTPPTDPCGCSSRLVERLALQVLEHEVVDPALVTDVVEHADVGVVEGRDRPRLALEALAQLGVPGEVLGQHLD